MYFVFIMMMIFSPIYYVIPVLIAFESARANSRIILRIPYRKDRPINTDDDMK